MHFFTLVQKWHLKEFIKDTGHVISRTIETKAV